MAQVSELSLPVQAAVSRAVPPRWLGPPPLWRARRQYLRWQWVTDGKNVQVVVKEGTSGPSAPSWNKTIGEITKDPAPQKGKEWTGVEWKNLGPLLLAFFNDVTGSLRLFQLAPAIDTPVRDPITKNIVTFLRNPTFDQDFANPGASAAQGCPVNFGSDVSDPAGFSPLVDPGSAICSILSAYAVSSCAQMRRQR